MGNGGLARFAYQPPAWNWAERENIEEYRHFVECSNGKKVAVYTIERNDALRTILYFHARSESCVICLPIYETFAQLWRANFVSFDLPGYGASEGSPTYDATLDAAVCVLKDTCSRIYASMSANEKQHHLASLKEEGGLSGEGSIETTIAARKLVLYGRSIGCHLAVEMALRCQALGLILQSPFKSLLSIFVGNSPANVSSFEAQFGKRENEESGSSSSRRSATGDQGSARRRRDSAFAEALGDYQSWQNNREMFDRSDAKYVKALTLGALSWLDGFELYTKIHRIGAGHFHTVPRRRVFGGKLQEAVPGALKSPKRCPTLLIHGTHDAVVPFSHSVELYRLLAAPVTPLWVMGAGHNDIELIAGDLFFEHVGRFLLFLLIMETQAPAIPGPVGPFSAQQTALIDSGGDIRDEYEVVHQVCDGSDNQAKPPPELIVEP